MPSSPVVRVPHRQTSFSFLSTASYSRNQIEALFDRAQTFENEGFPIRQHRGVLALLFFEPSTRTRVSFQIAAHRLGFNVVTLENAASSSLSKGESLLDTVANVVAMNPDALVIRYGHSPELDAVLPTLNIPVLNAGSGASAHPTQALLDAYTIFKKKGSLEGARILIVGDVRHSRVAASNFDVLTKLGAKIGVCGPPDFVPKSSLPAHVITFEALDEATEWCDVYMGLRIQMERHSEAGFPSARLADLDSYHARFGLTRERLQILKKDAMIMHPGPINHGVEFPSDDCVMSDPRNAVLDQVKNGVFIRAALLDLCCPNTTVNVLVKDVT